MSEKYQPAGITINRTTRHVVIKWKDGVESQLPFDGLRAVCPCVSCKGGHANMGLPPDPCTVKNTAATDLTINEVQATGSYALQILWSDGHYTGIYTWQTLRDADPAACAE